MTCEDLQAALVAEPDNPEAKALLHQRSVTVEKVCWPPCPVLEAHGSCSFSRHYLRTGNVFLQRYGGKLPCSYLVMTSKPCYSFRIPYPVLQVSYYFESLICILEEPIQTNSEVNPGVALIWLWLETKTRDTLNEVQISWHVLLSIRPLLMQYEH